MTTASLSASHRRRQFGQFGQSPLDRAIVASIAAMVGFNVLVLAQQFAAAPIIAAVPVAALQA